MNTSGTRSARPRDLPAAPVTCESHLKALQCLAGEGGATASSTCALNFAMCSSMRCSWRSTKPSSRARLAGVRGHSSIFRGSTTSRNHSSRRRTGLSLPPLHDAHAGAACCLAVSAGFLLVLLEALVAAKIGAPAPGRARAVAAEEKHGAVLAAAQIAREAAAQLSIPDLERLEARDLLDRSEPKVPDRHAVNRIRRDAAKQHARGLLLEASSHGRR